MKKNTIIATALFGSLLFFIIGCEIGTNPIILDSSISENITINQTTVIPPPYEVPFPVSPLYVDTKTLQDVTGGNVEKISFYNMTLMVDNNTTPDTGKITGRLMANDTVLVSITNLSPSVFSTEHSIFETIAGFHLNNDGLGIVLRAVKNPPPGGLKMQLFLGPTNSPAHFRLWIKVYGQIQTKAK